MKDSVKILLVGVGGYGATYLNPLLNRNDPKYQIAGMVEPYPERAKRIDEALEKGVPLYKTMAEFYAGHTADLAVIAAPIHLHTPMILEALANGSNVLCEKPLCGDDRDIEKLLEAEKKSGKFVYIGYQWSHSEAIAGLKRDIMAGVFGKPEMLKTLILWPRSHTYYGRGTGWAGHMYSKDGALIRDSVANNAAAHYLHNIFYILGDRTDTAKMPAKTEAKVYRANDIDSFDTAEIYCTFDDGAKAAFISTHACDINRGPEFVYRFEKGTVYYGEETDENGKKIICAEMKDGTRKVYGNPEADNSRKMYLAADRILNGTDDMYCGIEAASVQTRVIAEVHRLHPTIEKFPEDMLEDIEIKDQIHTVCKGLSEKLIGIYENL